jgi:hypothetical protein
LDSESRRTLESTAALLVETVAYQKQMAHWLRRTRWITGWSTRSENSEPPNDGRPTSSSASGALDPLINGGKVWVPYGTAFDALVKEIAMYSSAARHDDHLDCLADIWQYGVNPLAKGEAETRIQPLHGRGV